MTIRESHGFVLWGVPRFHRQTSETKPPAPAERKAPTAVEPPKPALQTLEKPEPVANQAA